MPQNSVMCVAQGRIKRVGIIVLLKLSLKWMVQMLAVPSSGYVLMLLSYSMKWRNFAFRKRNCTPYIWLCSKPYGGCLKLFGSASDIYTIFQEISLLYLRFISWQRIVVVLCTWLPGAKHNYFVWMMSIVCSKALEHSGFSYRSMVFEDELS